MGPIADTSKIAYIAKFRQVTVIVDKKNCVIHEYLLWRPMKLR